MFEKIFNHRKIILKIYWPMAIIFTLVLFALIIASLFIQLDNIGASGLNALGVTAISLSCFFIIVSIVLYLLYSKGARDSLKNKKITLEEMTKEFSTLEDQMSIKNPYDFNKVFKKVIPTTKIDHKDNKSETNKK